MWSSASQVSLSWICRCCVENSNVIENIIHPTLYFGITKHLANIINFREPTGNFASRKQCVHSVWGRNFHFQIPPDLELVRLFKSFPGAFFFNLVSTFKEKDIIVSKTHNCQVPLPSQPYDSYNFLFPFKGLSMLLFDNPAVKCHLVRTCDSNFSCTVLKSFCFTSYLMVFRSSCLCMIWETNLFNSIWASWIPMQIWSYHG